MTSNSEGPPRVPPPPRPNFTFGKEDGGFQPPRPPLTPEPTVISEPPPAIAQQRRSSLRGLLGRVTGLLSRNQVSQASEPSASPTNEPLDTNNPLQENIVEEAETLEQKLEKAEQEAAVERQMTQTRRRWLKITGLAAGSAVISGAENWAAGKVGEALIPKENPESREVFAAKDALLKYWKDNSATFISTEAEGSEVQKGKGQILLDTVVEKLKSDADLTEVFKTWIETDESKNQAIYPHLPVEVRNIFRMRVLEWDRKLKPQATLEDFAQRYGIPPISTDRDKVIGDEHDIYQKALRMPVYQAISRPNGFDERISDSLAFFTGDNGSDLSKSDYVFYRPANKEGKGGINFEAGPGLLTATTDRVKGKVIQPGGDIILMQPIPNGVEVSNNNKKAAVFRVDSDDAMEIRNSKFKYTQIADKVTTNYGDDNPIK